MQVGSAYLLVVFIWSTTPLAIQWSASSFSFLTALTLRMVLALVICAGLLRLLNIRLVQEGRDWWVFSASALGLFPNMALVYWASQYIPSGLMSILFGMYPFLVGIFSWLLFRESVFTAARIGAVLTALIGLIIIHFGQLQLGPNAALGVAAMMVSCTLWALSSVWVKRLGQHIAPLRQGTGSLLLSVPCFLLLWWAADGEVPQQVDARSAFGVGYLVLAGSVMGHTLFFYILRHCSAITVSLVALLAPVLAVTWGVLLAGEAFSAQTGVGAAMILASLFIYQGLYGPLLRRFARPRSVTASPPVRESV